MWRYPDWACSDFFDPDTPAFDLCKAIGDDDFARVRECLENNQQVANAVGKNGMRPLMWAIGYDRPACFESLLQCGAEPNYQVQHHYDRIPYFQRGQSSVITAALNSDRKFLELLLEYGAGPTWLIVMGSRLCRFFADGMFVMLFERQTLLLLGEQMSIVNAPLLDRHSWKRWIHDISTLRSFCFNQPLTRRYELR